MDTSSETGAGAPAPAPLTWHQAAALRTLARDGGPLTPYQVHPAKPVIALEALAHRGLATRGTIPGTPIITYTATPQGHALITQETP